MNKAKTTKTRQPKAEVGDMVIAYFFSDAHGTLRAYTRGIVIAVPGDRVLDRPLDEDEYDILYVNEELCGDTVARSRLFKSDHFSVCCDPYNPAPKLALWDRFPCHCPHWNI